MYIHDTDDGFNALDDFFDFDLDEDILWVQRKGPLPNLGRMLGDPEENPVSGENIAFLTLFDFLAFDFESEIEGIDKYFPKALKFIDYELETDLSPYYEEELNLLKDAIIEKYGGKNENP